MTTTNSGMMRKGCEIGAQYTRRSRPLKVSSLLLLLSEARRNLLKTMPHTASAFIHSFFQPAPNRPVLPQSDLKVILGKYEGRKISNDMRPDSPEWQAQFSGLISPAGRSADDGDEGVYFYLFKKERRKTQKLTARNEI